MAEETRGFLGRWAQRKTAAVRGQPLEEPAAVMPPASRSSAAVSVPVAADSVPATQVEAKADAAQQAPRELSLDDTKLLTKDSDFRPFMASKVGPDVRNAAMKKLFADPHFNLMDGLDIYIDDYSISEPIPESMLRQMASAKFLKLFDEEEEDDKKAARVNAEDQQIQALPDAGPQENANASGQQTVAQVAEQPHTANSGLFDLENPSQPESLSDSRARLKEHDHTDLRLQPDHAASAPETGRGT